MSLAAYNKVFFYYLVDTSFNMKAFVNEFPIMEYANFLELVDGLLEKIAREIESFKEGLSPEEIEELRNFSEYELLLEKQKYTLARKQEYLEQRQVQADNEKEAYRNIIFAKTPAGNPCLMQDLKDIDEENYDKFLETLKRLRNNDTDFNAEKQKPLTGSNALKGLYEIKAFQFRLIYMIINKDTVLVILAEDKVKDTTSVKKLRQSAERKELVKDQIKYYQKAWQDETLREQIIAKNDHIYEELVRVLSKGRKVK